MRRGLINTTVLLKEQTLILKAKTNDTTTCNYNYRKTRQSYRHADTPATAADSTAAYRCTEYWSCMVTSSRATVIVFVTM